MLQQLLYGRIGIWWHGGKFLSQRIKYTPLRCFRTHPSITQSWLKLLTTRYYKHGSLESSFHCSAVVNENIQFLLSDIGEGLKEVVVKEWHVKVGDKVGQFDSLCEVQSDKAVVTITSRYDGIIRKLYHDVEDVAQVGKPLVDIELDRDVQEDELVDSIADPITSIDSSDPMPSSISFSSSSDDQFMNLPFHQSEISRDLKQNILTTPAVRRISREKGVSLNDVRGTGKDGRILKEDVLRHIGEIGSPIPGLNSTPVPQSAVFLSEPSLAEPNSSTLQLSDREETIKGIKAVMVKTMTASLEIPHFGYCDEVDLSKLTSMRESLKDFAATKGVKLTLMALFIKAASLALKEFPILNSHFNVASNSLTYKAMHNIGVAMDTPKGLLVPNIKDCERLSVVETASELSRLMALGKEGKLGPDDLIGRTFSISNIGAIGGTYAKPVIVPPEVAIGAVGKMQVLPRFSEDGAVFAASIMCVSWSADHRVIDGATMARFSNLWKSYLEKPETLLISLR